MPVSALAGAGGRRLFRSAVDIWQFGVWAHDTSVRAATSAREAGVLAYDATVKAAASAQEASTQVIVGTSWFQSRLAPMVADVREKGQTWWTTRLWFIAATLVGLRFYLWWQYIALEVLVSLILGDSGDEPEAAAATSAPRSHWFAKFKKDFRARAESTERHSRTIALFLMVWSAANVIDLIVRFLFGHYLPQGVFIIITMTLEGVLSWLCWTRFDVLTSMISYNQRSSARQHAPLFNILEVLVESMFWECTPANALGMFLLPASNPARTPVDGDGIVGLLALAALLFMLLVDFAPAAEANASQRKLDETIVTIAELRVEDVAATAKALAAKLAARKEYCRRLQGGAISDNPTYSSTGMEKLFWMACGHSDKVYTSPFPASVAAAAERLKRHGCGTNTTLTAAQVVEWLGKTPLSTFVDAVFTLLSGCLVLWLLLDQLGPSRETVCRWLFVVIHAGYLDVLATYVTSKISPVALVGVVALLLCCASLAISTACRRVHLNSGACTVLGVIGLVLLSGSLVANIYQALYDCSVWCFGAGMSGITFCVAAGANLGSRLWHICASLLGTGANLGSRLWHHGEALASAYTSLPPTQFWCATAAPPCAVITVGALVRHLASRRALARLHESTHITLGNVEYKLGEDPYKALAKLRHRHPTRISAASTGDSDSESD